MPLLGAHMSIAGGLHMAFERIARVRGEALQVFTRNQRQWKVPALEHEEVAAFARCWETSGYLPVAAHVSYLVNLVAGDTSKLEKSVAAFAEELQRTARLGIPYLIAHPGSHLGLGIEPGLECLVRHLDRAIARSETAGVMVLLETTAGQGTNLGSSFEEIAHVLQRSKFRQRLGVCFDTCHCFAAGYDIRNPATYRSTFSQFERVIGLEKLKFFHLNDSKKGLGSRVDRHEHIGKGEIGLEGFRLLLNDARFHNHPMVLETPKGRDLKEDSDNLRLLRSLIQPGDKTETERDIHHAKRLDARGRAGKR